MTTSLTRFVHPDTFEHSVRKTGMQHRPVASIFLRHEGDILLVKRSQAVSSYPERWGTVAGHIESSESPLEAVSREITEETELRPNEWSLERTGERFAVTDASLDVEWQIHPVLVSTAHRDISTNWETAASEWTSPEAIHTGETVPELWKTYDRVRPTVETIRNDHEHGSAWLSLRALEVLRDEAIRAQYVQPVALHEVATKLCDARPTMTVLTNRINRVMSECLSDEQKLKPATVATATHEHISRAIVADSAAANHCANEIAGKRVATLSQSGTVHDALLSGKPEAVLVAESRPGLEGISVAERLRKQLESSVSVTVTTDAAFPAAMLKWSADVLLAGADSILANGDIINKVGTYSAMAGVEASDIDRLVVAATDKISSDTTYDPEYRPKKELYDGETGLACFNPTFERTPVRYLDALITDREVLSPDEIGEIASEHRALSSWSERF